MTSVGWLGLSPVAWSLVAVVSSSVGLWAARWAERRVHGWVRVGVRLLARGAASLNSGARPSEYAATPAPERASRP